MAKKATQAKKAKARKAAARRVTRQAAKRPAARSVTRQAAKRPAARSVTRQAAKRSAARRAARKTDALLEPIKGATMREIGGVMLEVVPAGQARVKRMIYPPGFKWSTAMKSIVGTDRCMHAHVGFLARGEIHIEYPDGCVAEYKAPQVVAIEPGHDGWVVGREPVVLIEFDFEGDTIDKLGMPAEHKH